MPDPFVSYAQNLEDVLLWRALGHVEHGFYIDVGAADPTHLSVTRALYDRGWRGIDIEPLPERAEALRAARPGNRVLQTAVADQPGTLPFYRVAVGEDTGLSTLDATEAARFGAAEPFDCPVTTLAEIARAHVQGPVHALKIDVEGAEHAVLRGADFTATRPWIVLVEATRPLSQEDSSPAWEDVLTAAQYRFAWFDGLNRFYVAAEHADLMRHFTTPPNVFDNYVRHDPATEAQVAALHEQVAALRTELAAAEARPAPEPEPEPPPAPVPHQPTLHLTAGRGPAARRLLLRLYGLVRPVARPIAWRARTFLTGPVLQEIAALRAQQDALLTRLSLQSAAPGGGGMLGMDSSAERLLLTLALEERPEQGV